VTLEGADLAAAVQSLVDDRAVAQIMINYARGIDRRDWDLVRSCFADDAYVQGTQFGGPRDEYLDILLPGVAHYPATQHFIGNQLRQVDGDTAFTETYLIARHFADAAGEVDSLIVGVRYDDQLRRVGAGWQIFRRDVANIWKRVGWPVPG
jgi:3-phenylpropionate/cinnamic acid dioxygenase small subunit